MAHAETTPAAGTLEDRFQAFVHSHRARAVSLAWRLVGGDSAAAEDVAQQAFLQAWKALPGFRDEALLSTWFFRILVRQAAAHRRWRTLFGLRRDRFEREPASSSATTGDAGLRRRIASALDTLSRNQREAFVLVHLEGFTVVEAAEVLGVAPGTIKSHLHRALTMLRTELADLEGGAP